MTLLHWAALIFFAVAIIESNGKNWIAWGLGFWLLAITGLPSGIPTNWILIVLVVILLVMVLRDRVVKGKESSSS